MRRTLFIELKQKQHILNIIFVFKDLKPSNIMITSEGIIKIGDFGSAIALDDKVNNLFEIEGFTRVLLI